MNSPILACFDPTKTCLLDCDASGNAIGGVLSQFDPQLGVKSAEVLAYGSKALSDAERKYDPYR